MKNSLGRDERGVAHILIIVLVVVVLAAVAFVGWEVMNKHSNKPSTVSSSSNAPKTNAAVSGSTVYATCLAKFHDTSLCHFAEAESAQPVDKTSYKATMTTNSNGTNTTLVFEQDGKGDNSLTTSGDSAAQLNSITYAGTLYIQNGSVWLKYPKTTTPPPTSDPSSNLSFLGSLVSEQLTKVDSEACGSLTCLKYKLVDSTTPNATQYIWFDTHSYLLREFSSSDPTNGSIDMKLSYQSVNISVPSPVEDFSASAQP